MKDMVHLPPNADILVDGCVEVVGLVDPGAGPHMACLHVLPEQLLQRLPMPLEHGEHEKGQHDGDHEQGSHAGAEDVLRQEEQRHARQRAQTEAEHLTLGQVEQEFGFDPRQVLGNRDIGHVGFSFRSVGIEQGLGDAARLEQREAQQHRITDARPQGRADVAAHSDALHQHRVDAHADHDEECLEAQGEERPQVVLAHLTPLAVDHGCHGNGSQRGGHVDFDHTPVHDDEDTDAQRPGDDAHQRGLEPQPKQRAHIHSHEGCFHVVDECFHIQRGISDDHPCGLPHHMLGHIKDRYDDVPGVGDNRHGCERLEDPLEEKEGVEVVHVVAVDQHLDQLQARHKSHVLSRGKMEFFSTFFQRI